jgi:hypothetical protein
MIKKNFRFYAVIFFVFSYLLLFSCSSVFRASLTGQYIDSENKNGINDGYVFLYISKDRFDKDWEDYQATKNYIAFFANCFSSTTTTTVNNQSGVFTFNAVVWSTLNPFFGKDADIHEIYLVFYHEDYGVSYSTHKIVSDSTTRLTPIKASKIKNSAIIHGKIVNVSSGEPIPNVTVRIYVPKNWNFDSNNNPIVNDSSFDNKPSYTTTTNANGEYTVRISFPKMPSASQDYGRTKIRIVYFLNDYETSNSIEPSLVDNNSWDPDGNWIYEDYYESSTILKDTTTQIPALHMKKTIFSESLNGIVKLSGNGVNGYKVKVTYKTRNNTLTSKSSRTFTYYPNNQTAVSGYFEINNLELSPDGTEGSQNYQDVNIEVYNSLDVLVKTVNNFRIYENADNYIEIEIP